jgi:hypothetical protein
MQGSGMSMRRDRAINNPLLTLFIASFARLRRAHRRELSMAPSLTLFIAPFVSLGKRTAASYQ